jgi:hypothetical protein
MRERSQVIPTGAATEPTRRRRIAARTRVDFRSDAVLLLGYTLAYSYGFTGIGIHGATWRCSWL